MSRRARYIVGCSFGKDSLATVITAVEHGEPLDEAVYCEVMFDEHISGEVPEHRDFIYGVGIPTLKSMGIKTTIIRGKRTYVSSFTRVIEKGPTRRADKRISALRALLHTKRLQNTTYREMGSLTRGRRGAVYRTCRRRTRTTHEKGDTKSRFDFTKIRDYESGYIRDMQKERVTFAYL